MAVEESYKYPDGIQLFDLESDPSETKNLADQHPETIAELSKLYAAWKAQMGKPVRAKH